MVEVPLASGDALLMCTRHVHRTLDEARLAALATDHSVDALTALASGGAAILCRSR